MRIKPHLVSAPWGRQVRVSLALAMKSAKPAGPFSPSGVKTRLLFFMVKNPGFEAGLPGFVTPLCYFLAVWSQASYSTSLSLSCCVNKWQ